MNDTNGKGPTLDQRNPVQVRSAYSTPSLRVLGTLADLTASGSKPGKETGGNVRGSKP